jgi:transcriptional regulator with XRE-family HTH domain
MTFGQRLRNLRDEKGMTQEDVARESGLSLSAIRDFERDRKEPSFVSAQSIAAALGVGVDAMASSGTGKSAKKRK